MGPPLTVNSTTSVAAEENCPLLLLLYSHILQIECGVLTLMLFLYQANSHEAMLH